jgi:O-antigen ligase
MDLLHAFSPHRFAQLTAASPILGPIPKATLSTVPAATRDEVFRLATYVLVYLLVCDLARRLKSSQWVLAIPIVICALLEAILGVIQCSTGADIAVGTYVNRNHFAGLLEMALPFAVMSGFYSISRNRDRFHTPAVPTMIACLCFGAAALMLVGVIDSQSRMGFIAVMASLLVIAVAVVSGRFSGARSRWLPMAAVSAIIALAFVFLPTDQLIGRFASIATTTEATPEIRTELWKETMPLIADYKAVGCGLGAYESCFLPYKKVAPNSTADFAHNDYLQIMAEFGLPAFVLLVVLTIQAYGTALRRSTAENPGRYLAVACAGSLTAILLHSFVDFNLYIPANGMLAVWVGAMAREA